MSRQRNTAISCRTLKGSARVSIPAFRFLRGLPMCNTEYNANVPFASAAFDTINCIHLDVPPYAKSLQSSYTKL